MTPPDDETHALDEEKRDVSPVRPPALEPWHASDADLPAAIGVVGQILQVNGKRMSHSYFKQLLEVDLVDKGTAELVGTPYGVVNWHPDGCDFPKARLSAERNAPHVHVLWQTVHGSWRRTLVSLDVDFWLTQTHGYQARLAAVQHATDRLLAAKVVEGWRPANADAYRPTWRLTRAAHGLPIERVGGREQPATITFQWDEFTIRTPVTDAICRLWHPEIARALHPETGRQREPIGADGSEWPDDVAFIAEQDCCFDRLADLCDGRTATAVRTSEVQPALAGLHAFRARWDASHAQIFALDQVFL